MAAVLHGSARTTPHLRAEFPASKKRSSWPLLSPTWPEYEDEANWRKGTTTGDALMAPEEAEEPGADAGREAIRGGYHGGCLAEDAGCHWTMSWLLARRDPLPGPQGLVQMSSNHT